MPCTGNDLLFDGNNVLQFKGPRSGSWPYAGCPITARNGMRLSTQQQLWAEPMAFEESTTGTASGSGLPITLTSNSATQLNTPPPITYSAAAAGRWFGWGVITCQFQTIQQAGIVITIGAEAVVNNTMVNPGPVANGYPTTRYQVGPPYAYRILPPVTTAVSQAGCITIPFVTPVFFPGDGVSITANFWAWVYISGAQPAPQITSYGIQVNAQWTSYRPTP